MIECTVVFKQKSFWLSRESSDRYLMNTIVYHVSRVDGTHDLMGGVQLSAASLNVILYRICMLCVKCNVQMLPSLLSFLKLETP